MENLGKWSSDDCAVYNSLMFYVYSILDYSLDQYDFCTQGSCFTKSPFMLE